MASLQKVLFLSLPKRGIFGPPVMLDSRILLCRHATSCISARKRLVYHSESWPRPYATATDPVSERMMPFEKYRKLKKALKWRARIAGIPMAFLGIAASSYVNVRINPDMFVMSPEEIKPILYVVPPILSSLPLSFPHPLFLPSTFLPFPNLSSSSYVLSLPPYLPPLTPSSHSLPPLTPSSHFFLLLPPFSHSFLSLPPSSYSFLSLLTFPLLPSSLPSSVLLSISTSPFLALSLSQLTYDSQDILCLISNHIGNISDLVDSEFYTWRCVHTIRT